MQLKFHTLTFIFLSLLMLSACSSGEKRKPSGELERLNIDRYNPMFDRL